MEPVSKKTKLSDNDAIAKLSKVTLSVEQSMLKGKILQFIRDGLVKYEKTKETSIFIIDGDAGTGKSVVLTSLFNEIQKISRTSSTNDILINSKNYLVINHPEMLKLYHRVARQYSYVKKPDLDRPTSIINKLGKSKESKPVDIIFIDEAHLLLSKKNAYKKFYQDNQLEELIKLSKIGIIIFDEKQSLRFDAFWDNEKLNTILKNTNTFIEKYYLKQQFRITAQPDVQDWIREFSVNKKVLSFPTLDRKIPQGFEFKIFERAKDLYQDLIAKNKLHNGGCRLLATYDYPYRLPSKNGVQKIWYVTTYDGFKIPWDKYLPQIQQPWSEQPNTYEHCGSVYTIQGFDLVYAGVILGPSVSYDEVKREVVVDVDKYEDHAAFMGSKSLKDGDKRKEKIVLNSINVLLTRGVKGLYLFAEDEKLRKKLLQVYNDSFV